MSEIKKNNRLIDDAQAFLAELSTDEESNLTGGGRYGYGGYRGYGDDDDDDDGGRRRRRGKRGRGRGKKGYGGYGYRYGGYRGYGDDEGD